MCCQKTVYKGKKHQNKRHVIKLLKGRGIDFQDEDYCCGVYVEGKQYRSFRERQQRATEPCSFMWSNGV